MLTGLDWGGLTREWVEVLCTALFSPEGHFFKRLQADDHQGLVIFFFNIFLYIYFYFLFFDIFYLFIFIIL